ncbi:MAG TPA: sigma-54-dependent Fis family transcriptional regulator, partial [Candidatus Parabacteroides intestinavium]|nr:sigma-54-dependent Fis family transcriptional regulator [Candidatus Parabacteroides intestinavium]
QLLKDESYEINIIRNALRECNFNKTRAAQMLGIDRKTLYNKLKAYRIEL